MNVLITGDSHTAALFMGQKQLEKERHTPAPANITIRPLGGGHLLREPFFTDQGDHAEIVLPQLRKQFERLPLAGDANEDLIYGICAPLHTARVWRDLDWRRFAPIGLATDETPISIGMLRRIILDDQKQILAFIDVLARNGAAVFAIEAPRPFRHHPVLKYVRQDVVLAIDSFYRELMRSELRKRSVPIVTVPAACLDPRGFTLEQFGRTTDPHHGNMKFGRLMMLEIEKFVVQFEAVMTRRRAWSDASEPRLAARG